MHFIISDCIVCHKSPSGHLRKVFRCAGLGTNTFLRLVDDLFGVKLIAFAHQMSNIKYCITCFSKLDTCRNFKESLENIANFKENVAPQHSAPKKRGNLGTPTPKKDSYKRTRQTSTPKKVELFPDHNYVRTEIPDTTQLYEDHRYMSLYQPAEKSESQIVTAHKFSFSLCGDIEDANLQQLLRKISSSLDIISSASEPGPSILQSYSNPHDLREKDIISDIILEIER